MALDVHSILLLDKKAVGVRFNLDNKFFDVEIEKLRGVKKEHLTPHKKETLLPNGNLLVTQDELDGKIKAEDASENERFCIAASGCLTSPPREAKEPAPQPKPQPKRAGKGKLFKVTVEVDFYNPMKHQTEKKQFTGEFEAKNALMARKEAKEWYALENGTDPSEINILSAVLAE